MISLIIISEMIIKIKHKEEEKMIVKEDRKTVRGTYCPFSRRCDQSCDNAHGAFCHIDDVYKEK